MVSETALLEIGVMFALLAIAGSIANTIDMSVIPFYIVVGILTGPHVLGALGFAHLTDMEFIELGAELGIVFLLFYLGLEFSLARLLEQVEKIGKAGFVDLAINFPLGFAIGLALGWSLLEAWLLAGVVYISSSAVITKSLIDRGWLANPESEPMLGTLVFEDFFIALYLAITTALVVEAGGGLASTLVPVGVALAAILVLLVLVYFGTAILQRLFEIDSNEQTLLRVVGITVLIAGAALAAGVSEAVAAFFVGMAVSSTGHVEEIEHLLLPVRDVFAAVFFFWIGLITDPLLFAGVLGILWILVVTTSLSKLASGYLSGLIYGLDERRSLRVGLTMVTRGEFSLIIATVAVAGSGSVMTEVIPSLAVAYVLVMSILGTILMQLSPALEGRLGLTPSPA